MNKFIKLLDKVTSGILIALVAFLALGVSVTVVLRYFFGLSYAWLEEFLTMSFIFVTLFGAAISIREKQHIAIMYLADKVVGSSKTRRIISTLLIDGVILFVCGFMLIYSSKWIAQVGEQLSQNSHLPMRDYYIFMPITMALSIFYTVVDIAGLFVKIDPPDEGYSTDDELPEE